MRSTRFSALWVSVGLAAAACDDGTAGDIDDGSADQSCSFDAAGTCSDGSCCVQDILATDLAIALDKRSARATIEIAAAAHRSVDLEVGDLEIESVTLDGETLEFAVADKRLTIARAGQPTRAWTGGKSVEIAIDYSFRPHDNFDGFLDAEQSDMSFTWPEFCGNLFPCVSHPSDGLKFAIEVTGVPEGQTAIFPPSIDFDAPSYMAAFTVGNYTFQSLGTTTAGTEVGVWSLPGGAEEAATATADLTAAFEFLEQTIGPYKFGSTVASVSVDWGDGDFGGMEHHPFWHLGRGSMKNTPTHHLSEGVTTYLEARVTEAVGSQTHDEIWDRVQTKFEKAINKKDFVVYPDGCNQIDSLMKIFTGLPYAKGALYLRQVENRIGRAAIDAALSSFYLARVGTAASMSDLIEHIEQESGTDLSDLTTAWLKTTGTPCMLEHGDCVPPPVTTSR